MRTRPRVRRTARRCWTSSCRPVLGIAAALASFIAPVSAGEWEDCQSANDAKMVAACTAVIEQGDRNPQDRAKAHLRRGLDERQRGLLDQAWTDFDAAVKLDPGSSTAFFQRGAVSRQKGDIDHAASDFERAITLDPKNANAYVGRGNVRFMRRDVPGAFADFDQAITLRPDFAFAYLSRHAAARLRVRLSQPRERLRSNGQHRSRPCRFRSIHRARSRFGGRPRSAWHRLSQKGRYRPCDRRLEPSRRD